MGRRNKGRPVNGILVLDKPFGISSNRALQNTKHLYFAAKAGHTGSLDPLATGVLPLCFGEATKFSQYLLDADKTYQSIIYRHTNRHSNNLVKSLSMFYIILSFDLVLEGFHIAQLARYTCAG